MSGILAYISSFFLLGLLFTSCWPSTWNPQHTHLCLHWCAQSHSTLCDPVACSPVGSSVHGISQARILEWVSISYSSGFSRPWDRTCLSCLFCIGRWAFLCHCATRKAPEFRVSPSYCPSDLLTLFFLGDFGVRSRFSPASDLNRNCLA